MRGRTLRTGTTVVTVTFKNIKTAKSTAKKYRCVVKAAIEEKPEEVVNAITSAKQATVKSFVVTTNFDAEAAQSKVSVKRGSNDVSTDKITYSDDGKTITILTTANIVEAEYTIAVGDLTTTVKGETSKIDTIEILGDKAAAVKDPATNDYKYATVGYKVTNQFGDDITKTTSLNVNSSAAGGATLSSKDHMITFYSGATSVFMINRDIITVTLMDTQSGKNASAQLTISMEAYAKDLTFEGVYNSEGKTLTEDSDPTADTFYLLFSAVDQYGNKFKSYKNVEEGTDLFLSVLGGMTTLSKITQAKRDFVVVTKDGTDYLAYPVVFDTTGMSPMNGEATIQLLSTGGTSCTGTVTVAEGNRVTAITVNSPGVIAAGEKTDLIFTATDASGKEVTAYKTLKNVVITGSTTCPVKWVKNLDGTGKLVLDAEALTGANRLGRNQTSMQTYTFKTLGQKFFHTQLTITENARPVAIDGLRDVDTTISAGTKYVEIKLKNLKVEDQYGRIMSNSALKNAATKETGIYQLRMSASDIYYTSADPSGNSVNITNKFSSIVDENTLLCKIEPSKKGDCAIDFQIHNGYGDNTNDGLNNAVASVLFTVKDTTEVETATVTVGDVYVVANNATQIPNKTAYAQDVIVKANGAVLPKDDYTVSVTGKMAEGAVNTGGGTDVRTVYFNGTQDDITEFKNNTASTVTAKIKVTLNGTGETITKDVTLSKVAPYVDSVSLKSDTYKTALKATAYPLSNYDVYDACFSELKDQYGKKLNISVLSGIKFANGETCSPNVTFSFKTSGKNDGTKVTDNGSKDNAAKLTIGTAFDAATMAVAFNGNVEDKKIAEINIVGVSGSDATGVTTPIENFNKLITDSTVTGSAAVAIIDGSAQLKMGTWSTLNATDKLKVAKEVKSSVSTQAAISDAQSGIEAIASKAAIARISLTSASALITTVTSGTITASSIDGVMSGVSTTLGVSSGNIVTKSGVNLVLESDATAVSNGAIAYITVDYTVTSATYLNTKEIYKVVATSDETSNVSYEITLFKEDWNW